MPISAEIWELRYKSKLCVAEGGEAQGIKNHIFCPVKNQLWIMDLPGSRDENTWESQGNYNVNSWNLLNYWIIPMLLLYFYWRKA